MATQMARRGIQAPLGGLALLLLLTADLTAATATCMWNVPDIQKYISVCPAVSFEPIAPVHGDCPLLRSGHVQCSPGRSRLVPGCRDAPGLASARTRVATRWLFLLLVTPPRETFPRNMPGVTRVPSDGHSKFEVAAVPPL